MRESADRVLIAGGGIAGLATAAALGRHGIRCVVLERRVQALDAGLGINLPGNAVMALGALGPPPPHAPLIHRTTQIFAEQDLPVLSA